MSESHLVPMAAARGSAFVSAHRRQAAGLGARLAELTDEPEAFVATLSRGLARLVDPVHAHMTRMVSPGVSAEYAVRGPLLEVVRRPLHRALGEGSSATALWLAERLAREGHRDLRLFALPCLRRSLPEDPELSWQLMRRLAAGAGDWIEVDSLADVWARGILAEPFRWAEIEQLAYSRRTFERRLVGATLATIPHRLTVERRAELRGGTSQGAFELVGLLMGDEQVMVQKALAWAIREWTPIDPEAAARLLEEETRRAVTLGDGSRAWVVRDSLSRQPAGLGAGLRARLEGLRRDRRSTSTSIAAIRSARFGGPRPDDELAVSLQGERYSRHHT